MDIKAELRLIREKCSKIWSEKIFPQCPSKYDSSLEDGCIDSETCKECWDKAIEEEIENE